MAQISCPDCGTRIDDRLPSCPYCGRPLGARSPDTAPMDPGLKMLLLGLLVVAVGGALWVQARSGLQERPASEARRAPEPVAAPPAATPSSRSEEVEWVEIDSVAGGGAAPDTSAAYEISMVEVSPQLMNRDEVSRSLSEYYPPLLRDAGVAGQVMLRFRVDPDGTVGAGPVHVLESTHDQFSEAAVRVARRMRFRPALVNGKPVPVWVQLPIQFTIAY